MIISNIKLSLKESREFCSVLLSHRRGFDIVKQFTERDLPF